MCNKQQFDGTIENIDIGETSLLRATAVVQSGGSIRIAEVIKAADEKIIAMVLKEIQHFKH